MTPEDGIRPPLLEVLVRGSCRETGRAVQEVAGPPIAAAGDYCPRHSATVAGVARRSEREFSLL